MEYVFMEPPFEMKDFKEMTKKEAQKHFDWYISEIPNRLEMLKKAFQITIGGKKEELDFSEESLIKVWDWYLSNVQVVEKTNSEVENEIRNLPEWISNDISSMKVSEGWISIAMDIAIYFAECFINSFSQIKWGFVSKPKNLDYVNKPVLVGFKKGLELDATGIIRILTIKIENDEKNSKDLLDLYKVWVELI